MMAGIVIALFNTITVKAMDNWSKLKTSYVTFHQETQTRTDLAALCAFCGAGLAGALLAAFEDSGFVEALAMAG
jgi:hypothetical protein